MEPNAVEDFLKDLKTDSNEDLFKQEVKVEEVKKEEDKPIPFNQDPKIAKFIEREVEKKLKDFQPNTTETFREETQDQSDEATEILTRIIGNDTPEKVSAIKDFKKYLGGLEDKGAQRALQQLSEQANEERQAEVDAQNELVDGFANIEETFGIDLTSEKSQDKRSKFVDFIKEVAPKDSDGQIVEYPDLIATYKLFEKINKPESNDRAKELASRSMNRSTDASLTPASTDKSWSAVDKLFSKLG